MKYHFKLVSQNKKTGPIPVTTTSKDSCPKTCPFYDKGCYAKTGPLNIHWNNVETKTGLSETEFFKLIKGLRKGQLWRHNQAGDLPHNDGCIDSGFVDRMIEANRGKDGFTYTHHKTTRKNLDIIRKANQNGFTINLSTESLDEAVRLKKKGFPIVAVIPSDTTEKHFEHKGEKIIVCPAIYRDNIQCYNCGLCQKANRKHIVAFPAHGIMKKLVDKTLKK